MDAATTRNQPDEDQFLDNPTYWFARLDEAVELGNFNRADEAREELRRLGYDVTPRAEAAQ